MRVVVCSLMVLYLVTFLGRVAETEAGVKCNILSLIDCKDAEFNGSPPSKRCCAKLRLQEPCLCEYFKDPKYALYFTDPYKAKETIEACGVEWPTCI